MVPIAREKFKTVKGRSGTLLWKMAFERNRDGLREQARWTSCHTAVSGPIKPSTASLQAHEAVIHGHYPAPEENLQVLAALRLQYLQGDYTPHAPVPPLEEVYSLQEMEVMQFQLLEENVTRAGEDCKCAVNLEESTGSVKVHLVLRKGRGSQKTVF